MQLWLWFCQAVWSSVPYCSAQRGTPLHRLCSSKVDFSFLDFWISGWYNLFPSSQYLSIYQSPLMRRTTAVDKCARVVFFIFCDLPFTNPPESALEENNTRLHVEITESVWLYMPTLSVIYLQKPGLILDHVWSTLPALELLPLTAHTAGKRDQE